MREWMKLVESAFEPANDGRPAEVSDAETDERMSAIYDRQSKIEGLLKEFLDHDASIDFERVWYDEEDNRLATIKTYEGVSLNQLELLKALGGDITVSNRSDGSNGLIITLIVDQKFG